MPKSLTLTAAGQIDGRLRLRFGKHEREFVDIAEVRAWVRGVLADEGTDDLLLALLLAKGFKSGNPASVVGKTITVDMTAASNIVRVT